MRASRFIAHTPCRRRGRTTTHGTPCTTGRALRRSQPCALHPGIERMHHRPNPYAARGYRYSNDIAMCSRYTSTRDRKIQKLRCRQAPELAISRYRRRHGHSCSGDRSCPAAHRRLHHRSCTPPSGLLLQSRRSWEAAYPGSGRYLRCGRESASGYEPPRASTPIHDVPRAYRLVAWYTSLGLRTEQDNLADRHQPPSPPPAPPLR